MLQAKIVACLKGVSPLFLIYVNNIAQTVPGGKLQLFADDTNLFVSSVNWNELTNKNNKYLVSSNQLCIANRLRMNLDKTNFMVFHQYKWWN